MSLWHRGKCPNCGFPVLVARWPTLGAALADHDRHCHPEIFRASPKDAPLIAAAAARWDRRPPAAPR